MSIKDILSLFEILYFDELKMIFFKWKKFKHNKFSNKDSLEEYLYHDEHDRLKEFENFNQNEWNNFYQILCDKLRDDDLFAEGVIEIYNIEIKSHNNTVHSFYGLVKYYKKLFNYNLTNEKISFVNYLSNHIIFLLFDWYEKNNFLFNMFRDINIKDNNFINLYKSKNINLYDDYQYSKYKLLSLDKENFELCGSNPFQLKDKRINEIITFSDLIPNNLSMENNYLQENLWEYLSKDKIKSLSIRPDFYNVKSILNGLSIQFGYQDKLKLPEINKLTILKWLKNKNSNSFFSLEYPSNQLWISSDGESELIIEEFKIDSDVYQALKGYVYSSMIHMKYFKENEQYFIEHLDHEYIFYSSEEFEMRKKNINIKGKFKKRIKTFKIDNSKIPLISENDFNFLRLILGECLMHINLINSN